MLQENLILLHALHAHAQLFIHMLMCIADTILSKSRLLYVKLFLFKKVLIARTVAQRMLSITCEALVTQIKMRIRVCERNMKTPARLLLGHGKGSKANV